MDSSTLSDLDAVFIRLLGTSEESLGPLLSILLPRLLTLLNAPHEGVGVKNKTLEILTHINSCVRTRPVPLPFPSLLDLLRGDNTSSSFPIIRHYTALAFSRLSHDDIDATTPPMLHLSSFPEGPPRDFVSSLILRALPHVHIPPEPVARAAKFTFVSNPLNLDLLGSLLVDGMLLVTGGTGIEEGRPPPGMSLRSWARALGATPVAGDSCTKSALALPPGEIQSRKLGIIKFSTASGVLPSAILLPIALAGLGETRHDVLEGCEDALRRAGGGMELESEGAIKSLLALFLGGAGHSPEDARSPASLPVRLRALTLLSRSRLMATPSYLPASLKICFEGWFGKGSSDVAVPGAVRLQCAGVIFAQSVAALAPETSLLPIAPLLLTGLTKLLSIQTGLLLSSPTLPPAPALPPPSLASLLQQRAPTHSGLLSAQASKAALESTQLRQGIYRALATLCTRAPGAVVKSSTLATLAFQRLGEEDSETRVCVGELVGALLGVYTVRRTVTLEHPGVSEGVLGDIRGILEESMSKDEPRVRLAAAEWAGGVFAFSDVRARYTCLVLLGDSRVEVREAARMGLRPFGRVGLAWESVGGKEGGADRDRGDLSGISRRADPHTFPGGPVAVKEPLESGAAPMDEIDALSDPHAFARLACVYPVFNSMVRFFSTLGEKERDGVQRACSLTPFSSVTGGDGGAWVRREVVEGSGVALVEQGFDMAPLALGSTVTRLNALSLAGLLEFTNTCLDATAVRAGKSTGEYVAWLANSVASTAPSLLTTWRCLIDYALAFPPSSPDARLLHTTAASALSQLMITAPEHLCALYSSRLPWVFHWLAHPALPIRASFAVVLGSAASALPTSLTTHSRESGGMVDGPLPRTTLTQRELIDSLMSRVAARGQVASSEDPSWAASSEARGVEALHGAILALGHVVVTLTEKELRVRSECPVLLPPLLLSIVNAVVHQLKSSRYDTVRVSALGCLTELGRCGALRHLRVGSGHDGAKACLLKVAREGVVHLKECGEGEGKDEPDTTLTSLVLLLTRVALGADGGGGSDMGDDMEGGGGSESAPPPKTSKARVLSESSATALGALSSGYSRHGALEVSHVSSLLPIESELPLLALYTLAHLRSEGVHFTVGAALGEAASGIKGASSWGAEGMAGGIIEGATFSGYISAFGGASAKDHAPPSATPVLVPPPKEAQLRALISAHILEHLLSVGGPLNSFRPWDRVAGSAWVLQVLHVWSLKGEGGHSGARRGGLGFEALAPRIPRLQVGLTKLLGDKSPVVQDCAGAALSFLFDAADSEGRKVLTRSLVESLQTGFFSASPLGITAPVPTLSSSSAPPSNSAAPPDTTAPAAPPPPPTPLGDASYREMCSIASGVGSPDLVYRFLALSRVEGGWRRKEGAGIGLEALLRTRAREAIAPHLQALIPRLFRYLHDPSPRVRESMSRLWVSLVKEPRKAIAAHVHAILPDLVAATSSPTPRERTAACAALASLLPSLCYSDIAPHLGGAWRAVLRALDDVSEEVRDVGMDALNSLGRLSLRFTDPSQTPAKEGEEALTTVLPLLINEGLSHPLPPAAKASTLYTVSLVKAAGHRVRPFIPLLVNAALSSLSSSEASELSYLQMHADGGSAMHGGGLTSSAVEEARVALASRSPLADTLERCLRQLGEMPPVQLLAPYPPPSNPSSTHTLEGPEGYTHGVVPSTTTTTLLGATVDVLRAHIRTGVGLPTRAVSARFTSSLCMAVGETLRGCGAATSLLHTLQGALLDSSLSLRREFGKAAGSVARWCPPATLRAYVQHLCGPKLGGSGDGGERCAGAWALAYLLKGASDGVRDFMGEIVATAFLGSVGDDGALEEEEGGGGGGGDRKDAWEELWLACTTSHSTVCRMFTSHVSERIVLGLESPFWSLQRMASFGICAWVKALIPDAGSVSPPTWIVVCGPSLNAPQCIPQSSTFASALLALLKSGRAWKGKEPLLKALTLLIVHCLPPPAASNTAFLEELIVQAVKPGNPFGFSIMALDACTYIFNNCPTLALKALDPQEPLYSLMARLASLVNTPSDTLEPSVQAGVAAAPTMGGARGGAMEVEEVEALSLARELQGERALRRTAVLSTLGACVPNAGYEGGDEATRHIHSVFLPTVLFGLAREAAATTQEGLPLRLRTFHALAGLSGMKLRSELLCDVANERWRSLAWGVEVGVYRSVDLLSSYSPPLFAALLESHWGAAKSEERFSAAKVAALEALTVCAQKGAATAGKEWGGGEVEGRLLKEWGMKLWQEVTLYSQAHANSEPRVKEAYTKAFGALSWII